MIIEDEIRDMLNEAKTNFKNNIITSDWARWVTFIETLEIVLGERSDFSTPLQSKNAVFHIKEYEGEAPDLEPNDIELIEFPDDVQCQDCGSGIRVGLTSSYCLGCGKSVDPDTGEIIPRNKVH